MTYSPLTDFIGLIRNTGGSASVARMPGLDYVVAAMARAGLFRLWTGQSPPTANQATTVWLQPSTPSWVAEGNVFLWDAFAGSYASATPALWDALLTGFDDVLQSVTVAAASVNNATSTLVIQRAGPAATTLTLPNLATRNNRDLVIVDWSTSVVNHVISLVPVAGATIMQRNPYALFSTAEQLQGVTLRPSRLLNAWIIAP